MKKLLLLGMALSVLAGACKKEAKSLAITENLPLPATQTITLPVVFHILHDGTATGFGINPPAATIEALLDSLNRCFGGAPPGGINTYIQFRLAVTGPSGATLAEAGIDRVNIHSEKVNLDTLSTQNTWKHELIWNPDQYINVFLINSEPGSVGGFATLPFSLTSHPIPGLVPIGPAVPWDIYPLNQGLYLRTDLLRKDTGYYRIVAHEMGHYLGLYHPFQYDSCTVDGDYCADTHDYLRSYFQSPASDNRTGCDGVAFRSFNFMDYPPVIQVQFTPLQIERMRLVCNYAQWRAKLLHSQARYAQPAPATGSSPTSFPSPIIME